MAIEFDFLSAADKPALLAISNPEVQATIRSMLQDMEYKVHVATDHADFGTRFSQVAYQLVVIEELFCCSTSLENFALQSIQTMPMVQRRHSVIILIGDSFRTLNPMEAFQQSVHAVINRQNIDSMPQIVQKIVGENDLFMRAYRDTQTRIAEGKA